MSEQVETIPREYQCGKCGKIYFISGDHICPEQRVSLTEKGLAEIKNKRPYTKRSRFWRITLKQRISAAIKAFRLGI